MKIRMTPKVHSSKANIVLESMFIYGVKIYKIQGIKDRIAIDKDEYHKVVKMHDKFYNGYNSILDDINKRNEKLVEEYSNY